MDTSKTTNFEIEDFLKQGKMVRERSDRISKMRQKNEEEIEELKYQNNLMETQLHNLKQVISTKGDNEQAILKAAKETCKECQHIMNDWLDILKGRG